MLDRRFHDSGRVAHWRQAFEADAPDHIAERWRPQVTGSGIDTQGPDALAKMVRFFLGKPARDGVR